MNPDAMTTRMSVLTRALPRRILLVDDDDLILDLIEDRLASAGFDVARAMNGEQALNLLSQQWFPVVITDWRMPVMDGIEFTQALRSRGVEDTYIIMLSMRDGNLDFEHGYISGVDDYLSKSTPDAELLARIHAAFNTLALRRSLKETQEALEDSVSIDAQSGAFAAGELYGKLHAEIRRAQRYGRQLAVIAVNVADAEGAAPEAEVLRALVQTIDSAVRAHVDWVGRLDASAGAAFAVVLPEAGVVEAPVVKNRLLRALKSHCTAAGWRLSFDVGAAAVDRTAGDGAQVDAKEMLDVAAHCLGCPGRAGEEQLRAVQRSVACHVAIACRHGYVVDSECTLKQAAEADQSAAMAAG